MKENAHLWRFDGTVGRGTYAMAGFLGFAIQHNVDRWLAASLGARWTIWNYWLPVDHLTRSTPLPPEDRQLCLLLLLTALPFIGLGVTLTIRRLRDAGQPLWLAALFFAPIVNLLFFALLCLLPSRYREAVPIGAATARTSDANFYPESRLASAALGAAISALIGVIMTWIDLQLLGNYGLTLFVALPFVMGYIAVWIHYRRAQRSLRDVVSVVTLSVVLAAAGIAAVAIEGLICLIMALPIAWPLAFFGGILAHVVHHGSESPYPRTSTLTGLVLMLPLMLGAEHSAPPPVPRFEVRTSMDIAAPPEIVWRRVISFPTLAPPREWPFRVGIAYPVEARLRGEGLTADRECLFSTGSFKEPILVWEPPKHFAFSIADEPLLMRETSPYGDIHVRHLEDHDFQPERADFLLTPLPSGGTRLEGISSYQNKMWPGIYWRIWTDAIVHSIHHRVFEHVKNLAEADARAKQTAELAH